MPPKTRKRPDAKTEVSPKPLSAASTKPIVIRGARRMPSPSPSPRRNRLLDDITPDDIANFQRLHLIVDLDATFVSTYIETTAAMRINRVLSLMETQKYPKSAIDELSERVTFFGIDGINSVTVVRPGAFEFVEFASVYFKSVNVWSAGQRDYVEKMVSVLFPPHVARPGVVFSWDDCREETKPSSRKRASPSSSRYTAFSKPMSEMLSHLTNGADETNTIFLDDRSDIAVHNPKNLAQIPPFEPSLTVPNLTVPDYALEHFTEWLLRKDVIHAKDVRELDMESIFSRDPQIPIVAHSGETDKV